MKLSDSLLRAMFLPSDKRAFTSSHGQQLESTAMLHGKPLSVSISRKALAQLEKENKDIEAEIELYFSCLIRKRVLFHELDKKDKMDESEHQVLPGLWLRFNAVTTKECSVAENPDAPLNESMPIIEPGRFVPDWIKIDYRSGKWKGEYGYLSNHD